MEGEVSRNLQVTVTAVLIFSASIAVGEHGHSLTEDAYTAAAGRLGVIILEVNWGRRWNCGAYENAQLQRLTFNAGSPESGRFDGVALNLETPSRLFVDNEFTPMAIMVEPGQYALTGFDVKVARSVSDVGHYIGTDKELLPDGQPRGGTLSIAAGEIIYIGHFGLDCGNELMPWRYYLTEQEEFVAYVGGFRDAFPFTASSDVEYRLFDTETIGRAFAVDEPVVPGIAIPDN